jgi:hypothetical protein
VDCQKLAQERTAKTRTHEDGITDMLSLTVQENVHLALVIDGLMRRNGTRNGYQVPVGK